jgi:RimJ/RimL family protein N-acetyltransferase
VDVDALPVEVSARGDRHAELRFRGRPAGEGWQRLAAVLGEVTQRLFDRGVQRVELPAEVLDTALHRAALHCGFVRDGLRRDAGPSAGTGSYGEILWGRLSGDPPGPTPQSFPDLAGDGLTDGSVSLRPLRLTDAADIHRLVNLPEVYAHYIPPVPRPRERIERRCAYAASEWLSGRRADLTIRDAATDAFAGHVQLVDTGVAGEVTMGISVAPSGRGRGFASGATRLLGRWALESAGFARVVANTTADNLAAQRSLQASGFVPVCDGLHFVLFPGPVPQPADRRGSTT